MIVHSQSCNLPLCFPSFAFRLQGGHRPTPACLMDDQVGLIATCKGHLVPTSFPLSLVYQNTNNLKIPERACHLLAMPTMHRRPRSRCSQFMTMVPPCRLLQLRHPPPRRRGVDLRAGFVLRAPRKPSAGLIAQYHNHPLLRAWSPLVFFALPFDDISTRRHLAALGRRKKPHRCQALPATYCTVP